MITLTRSKAKKKKTDTFSKINFQVSTPLLLQRAIIYRQISNTETFTLTLFLKVTRKTMEMQQGQIFCIQVSRI